MRKHLYFIDTGLMYRIGSPMLPKLEHIVQSPYYCLNLWEEKLSLFYALWFGLACSSWLPYLCFCYCTLWLSSGFCHCTHQAPWNFELNSSFNPWVFSFHLRGYCLSINTHLSYSTFDLLVRFFHWTDVCDLSRSPDPGIEYKPAREPCFRG